MSDAGRTGDDPDERGTAASRPDTPAPPPPPAAPVPPPAAYPAAGSATPGQPPAGQAPAAGGFDAGAYPPPAGPAFPPHPGYPPQQGYPPQPGAPAPGAQPPAKGIGVGGVIGIAAGGVVLLIILVAVVVFALRPGGAQDAGGAAGDASSTPSSVVTGYLEALAEGDAEAALSYGSDQPADTTLLTDEMLAASLELGPIDDIEVTETPADGISADVPATYTIGGETVSTTWSVHDYDNDGDWELTTATAEITLSGNLEGLELTLNGEEIGTPDTLVVFPGAYEITTTTPDFALSGATEFLVRDPFDSPRWNDVTVSLTDDGLAAFRQAVSEAVAACVASKNFVAGCGLDLPQTLDDGTVLVEGTLTRTLSAEAQATLDSLEPQESFSDPLLVRGEFIGGVNVTAGVEGGGTGDILFAPSLGSPLVDFSSGEPVVRWD